MGSDPHHVANNGRRRIECAAVLALRQRKVAEEVLIDLAENINGAVFRNVLEDANDVGKQLRFFFRDRPRLRNNENRFIRFATFTVTKEDAKRYLCKDSSRRRVHCWQDFQVNLYL